MYIQQVKDMHSREIYFQVNDVRSQEAREELERIEGCYNTKGGYRVKKTPILLHTLNKIKDIDNQAYIRAENTRIENFRKFKEEEYRLILERRRGICSFASSMKKAIINHEPVEGYNGRCAKLMNHQKAASLIADKFNKYAFFFDTGTGKTLLSLDIIDKKARLLDAHFLIICPKTIIQTAWMEDCTKFFPDIKLFPLSNSLSIKDYSYIHFKWASSDGTEAFVPPKFYEGSATDRIQYAKRYLKEQAQHFIVNPELFIKNPEMFLHIKCGSKTIDIDGLIVDESAMMKNQGSNISRTIVRLSSQLKYVYLLSGKPAPNKIVEYYPQIKSVAPELFNQSMISSINSEFKKQDMKVLDDFINIIEMASMTVSKKDCFDLPKTTNAKRLIQLSSAAMSKYEDMEYQMYVEIQSIDINERKVSNVILANHILAKIQKLRQISSGFIISEKTVKHIHNEKLNELLMLIEELGDSQAIIWCQYQYEVELIERTLKERGLIVVTAYSLTKNVNDRINDFKSKRAQFIVAHPRTLGLGVTLVNCNYAIYYSISYSFADDYQSHDRIYRFGQKLPCTYIYLLAQNTIDEIMYTAIQNKKSRNEMIEVVLKQISQKKWHNSDGNAFENEYPQEISQLLE